MTSEPEIKPVVKRISLWGHIQFYFTAFFVLLAISSSFIFVFLVPFVIDPGFATLNANFNTEAVTCVTVESISRFGMSNCLWASCREGCTRDIFECTQIYVHYLKDTDGILEGKNYTDLSELHDFDWQYRYAKIFPNVRGCGYPPEVNCTKFIEEYSTNGTTFPCYYSHLMPNITITSLDLEEVRQSLIYSIALPWGAFIVSVLYLMVTYVRCGKKPDQEGLMPDELQETNSDKAVKDASNYSLRSIGKSINQGVNRLRGEADDKGTIKDPHDAIADEDSQDTATFQESEN